MAGSRANWEDIISQLKENTASKSKAARTVTPTPTTPSAAQATAEKAGRSLGGAAGTAANTLIDRKKRQQEILDSLDY